MGSQSPQSPEDEAAEYKRKTEAAKARGDYVQTVEDLNNPPSVKAIQEQRVQNADEERKAAEQRTRDAEDRERDRVAEDKRVAEEKAAAEEQARIAAENELKSQQNQILLEKINELKTSQKPIHEIAQEYFTFAQTLAEQMGFQRPGTSQPQSENPQIALEIAKINAESAQREREHQLQMENDRRKWEIELMKLQDGRVIEQAKLAQQAKRDEAFMQAPQILGAALAQGLADHARGGAPSERVIQQPSGQNYKFTAGIGDSGEIDCPVCAARGTPTKVGIGPNSDLAQCVGCNTTFDVERVPAKATAEPSAEENA